MKINSTDRSVRVGANTNIESIIMELALGVIFFIMSFSDWGNGKTILFWPCMIMAGLCFALVIHSVINIVMNKLSSGKIKDEEV